MIKLFACQDIWPFIVAVSVCYSSYVILDLSVGALSVHDCDSTDPTTFWHNSLRVKGSMLSIPGEVSVFRGVC